MKCYGEVTAGGLSCFLAGFFYNPDMASSRLSASSKRARSRGGVTIRDNARVSARDIIGGDVIIQQAAPPALTEADWDEADRRYLRQVIHATERLGFVGIPTRADQPEVQLEDIFIPPTAELGRSPAPAGVPGTNPLDKDSAPLLARRVTLAQALAENTNHVILGDPGAGKSTLLRYLVLSAAHARLAQHKQAESSPPDEAPTASNPAAEPRLPVLVSLGGLASSDLALPAYFYAHARQAYQLDLPPGFFERALEAGRALVCFDGLDEVVAPARRSAVRDAVTAFASLYAQTSYAANRIVVSSRTVGYERAPLDRRMFTHLTLLPFSDEDTAEFIRRWYALREPNPARARSRGLALLETLRRNERLRRLAENPLLLMIIALIHHVEAELPNERVRLYDKCTEALLTTWESVKDLPVEPAARERPHRRFERRLFEKLAFWMHTRAAARERAYARERAASHTRATPGKSTASGKTARLRAAAFKRGDLELALAGFLREDGHVKLSRDEARAEAAAFLDLASERAGLLVERGDGVFAFVHITFEEYFCACDLERRYVHDMPQLWREVEPRLYDADWREVILLLLGRLNQYDEPASALVERILDAPDAIDRVIRRELFLAASAVADHVDVRATLRKTVLDRLIRFAGNQRPRFHGLRDDALTALGALLFEPRAHAFLLRLAQDARASDTLRIAAVQLFADAGENETARQLVEWAQAPGERWTTRLRAAEILAEVGETQAAGELLHALARQAGAESDWLQIAHAALSFEQLMPALLARIASDPGLLGGARLLATALQSGLREDADGVLGLVRAPNGETPARLQGSVLAMPFGETRDVLAYLDAVVASATAPPDQRVMAARLLNVFGEPGRARSALVALAEDPAVDFPSRLLAAGALVELGEAETARRRVENLVQSLPAGTEASMEAAAALMHLGLRDRAIGLLLDLKRTLEPDDPDRLRVARLLAELGQVDAAVRAARALAANADADALVRVEAAREYARLGGDPAWVIKRLLNLVESKNITVRDECYQGLKENAGALRLPFRAFRASTP